MLLQYLGRWEEAEACAKECLALNRQLRSPRPLASALHNVSYFQLDRGEAAAAAEGFRESRHVARGCGAMRDTVSALCGEALAEALAGHFDVATPLADEALQLAERPGEYRAAATASLTRGQMHMLAGEPEAARSAFARVRSMVQAGARFEWVIAVLYEIVVATTLGDADARDSRLEELRQQEEACPGVAPEHLRAVAMAVVRGETLPVGESTPRTLERVARRFLALRGRE